MSRDSYGGEMVNPLSMNKYAYVENNPINFIDPTGLHHYTPGAEKRISQINSQLKTLGNQYNSTSDFKRKKKLHAQADKLRIEKKQVIYWDPKNDDGSRRILQREISGIRKEHGWSYGQTQFYNPIKGIDPYGISKYYPKTPAQETINPTFTQPKTTGYAVDTRNVHQRCNDDVPAEVLANASLHADTALFAFSVFDLGIGAEALLSNAISKGSQRTLLKINLQLFAKKRDIKQIESIAKEFNMRPEMRRAFGDYVESLKGGLPNNKNFSYNELREIAKEFLGK